MSTTKARATVTTRRSRFLLLTTHLFLAILATPSSTPAQQTALTETERAWLRAHPTHGNAHNASSEECIIQDDDDQPIVAILPAQQYEAYREYLRRREQNFSVLDRIAKKTKNLDLGLIEQKINQAVEEVKTPSRSANFIAHYNIV